MLRYILLFPTLIALYCGAQDNGADRHVMRTWPNGNPHIVYFTKGEEFELVKEETYFESGALDYVGTYKQGKEHGEWIYYWENGVVRAREHYVRGLENGEMFDYNDQGQKIRRYVYKKGELITEEEILP